MLNWFYVTEIKALILVLQFYFTINWLELGRTCLFINYFINGKLGNTHLAIPSNILNFQFFRLYLLNIKKFFSHPYHFAMIYQVINARKAFNFT